MARAYRVSHAVFGGTLVESMETLPRLEILIQEIKVFCKV